MNSSPEPSNVSPSKTEPPNPSAAQPVGTSPESSPPAYHEISPEVRALGRMFAAQIEATQSISVSSGPLPPPEVLKAYEEVLKGAAKRIFEMAERQAAHRQDLEKKVTESEIRRSYAGIAAGLVVALTCVVGGLIAICAGHDTAGAAVATTTVASLTGIFIYGSISRKHERQEKAKILTGQAGPPPNRPDAPPAT